MVEQRELDRGQALAGDVLAAVEFGTSPSPSLDPRRIAVPLAPLAGHGLTQVWKARGPVRVGQSGRVRFATDGTHLIGQLEIDEAAHGGLAGAAEAAYRELLQFHATSAQPHVWRIWNFIGDINAGMGDDERYKQFCLGRARAFDLANGGASGALCPAATAVGTLDGRRLLTVHWLAGVAAGRPLENPRQISAYSYPRQYGPAAPSFSRALLAPGGPLLVSGTASIVGYESRHNNDVQAQLEETILNLDAIMAAAPGLPRGGRKPVLTVYMRRLADATRVARRLREHYATASAIIVVEAAICRSELLLEIEAVA